MRNFCVAALLVVGCASAEPAPQPSTGPGDGAAPAPTPPVLLNRAAVQGDIVRNYPNELRDDRIGGTVELWILVSEDGRPARITVHRSSGNARLDNFAMSVAGAMRFTPGTRDGKPTSVFVNIPLILTPPPPRTD
jgi:periplasmic protein TonB